MHSLEDGILDTVEISEEAREKIVENHLIKKPGDSISTFTGANTTLGCFVMKFSGMDEMLDMMDNSEKWIRVRVK